jgi:DNA primase
MPDEEPLLVEVDGQRLRITHPTKVMFSDEDITKAEILPFYLSDTKRSPREISHRRQTVN